MIAKKLADVQAFNRVIHRPEPMHFCGKMCDTIFDLETVFGRNEFRPYEKFPSA
jgi:hypothetical protein